MVAMEPQYFAIFIWVCYEATIITLLVSPMPNNQIRGVITKALTGIWKKSVYFRNTHWIMLAVNAYFFYASMHALHSRPAEHNIEIVTCEGMLMKMVMQRNAYITGFGVFLFFVMRRMLDIQLQLHKSRVMMKKLEKGAVGTSGLRPTVSQDDTWDTYVDTDETSIENLAQKTTEDKKKE